MHAAEVVNTHTHTHYVWIARKKGDTNAIEYNILYKNEVKEKPHQQYIAVNQKTNFFFCCCLLFVVASHCIGLVENFSIEYAI